MIVDFDLFKTSLKVDFDDEAELIEELLEQAQAAAEDYTGCTWTEENAPGAVRAAVQLMAAFFYEKRENVEQDAYRQMRQAFNDLLWPHRAPDMVI